LQKKENGMNSRTVLLGTLFAVLVACTQPARELGTVPATGVDVTTPETLDINEIPATLEEAAPSDDVAPPEGAFASAVLSAHVAPGTIQHPALAFSGQRPVLALEGFVTPIVSYTVGQTVFTRRWNGQNWQTIGRHPQTRSNLASTYASGKYWLSYVSKQSGGIYVKIFNSSSRTWTWLNTQLRAPNGKPVSKPSIAVQQGVPIVAFGAGNTTYVYAWNGSRWNRRAALANAFEYDAASRSIHGPELAARDHTVFLARATADLNAEVTNVSGATPISRCKTQGQFSGGGAVALYTNSSPTIAITSQGVPVVAMNGGDTATYRSCLANGQTPSIGRLGVSADCGGGAMHRNDIALDEADLINTVSFSLGNLCMNGQSSLLSYDLFSLNSSPDIQVDAISTNVVVFESNLGGGSTIFVTRGTP
jgi:hypothetical protein